MKWVVFGKGKFFGLTIDRCRGTEDQGAYPCSLHGLKKINRANNIVIVVSKRTFYRFTQSLETGEVNNGFT